MANRIAGDDHSATPDNSLGSPVEDGRESQGREPNKISRIGLLLEDLLQPAWASTTVKRLLNDADVSIALVVLAEALPAPKRWDSSLRQVAEYGLVEAFEKLDKRILGRSPDPFASLDLEPLLDGIRTVATELHVTKDGWQLPTEDVEEIRSVGLDAMLYFGEEGPFCGGILSAAQHGLWLFRHGSPPPYKGARSGFWETLAREMTATAALVAVTNEGAEELWRSVTAAHHVSADRTRGALYWTSTSFPERALKRVRDGQRLRSGRGRQVTVHEHSWTRDLPTESANRRLLRYLPPCLSRAGRESMRALLGNNQWFLAFTWADEGIVPSMAGHELIVPPKDRFWADPHVVRREDSYFVFVEEFLFSRKRGRIAVLILDKSGVIGGPMTVLERPYHLSYPFMFEHEGDLYLVPETSEHHTIELYRCVEFPAKWEFVRNLMQDVTALDTTLLLHAGRWWLFASISETEGSDSDSELFLFTSDDPVSGEWTPHPRNPIVSDACRARPAGKIFEQHGKLLRPSQQTVPEYGYAVHINEILTLTDEEYIESDAACLLPDWERGLMGTHTLSRAGDLTIVDGYRWRCRFA